MEGETLQASAVKNGTFTRAAYMQIIALKTAALFRSAGTIGAKMAQATQREIDALSEFGFQVGMAFQIVDDILDLVADEETLGKPSGIDIGQGRGVAVALQRHQWKMAARQQLNPLGAIKRKMMEGDTVDKARQQAEFLAAGAIASLSFLENSPAKLALQDLAQRVIDREKLRSKLDIVSPRVYPSIHAVSVREYEQWP